MPVLASTSLRGSWPYPFPNTLLGWFSSTTFLSLIVHCRYSVLGVEQDDIKECCYRIICLYQRSKPIQDELEREVASLKKARDDKRNAARGNNAVVGGAVDSPASQPSSPVRQERNGGEEGRGGRGAGSDGETRDRSRSRSRDRNRRRKKGHGRDHSHSGSDREINSRNSKSRKGKKRDRSWSHSPPCWLNIKSNYQETVAILIFVSCYI